jgi:hypothetical protein
MTRIFGYWIFLCCVASTYTLICQSGYPPLTVGALSGALVASSVNSALNPNSCASSTPASWCKGSDMGAWINAAVTALGGPGTITIPPGTFTYTTTIIKPRYVSIIGAGGNATILSYNLSTGYAIVCADTSGLIVYPEGQLADLTIQSARSFGGITATSIAGNVLTVKLGPNPSNFKVGDSVIPVGTAESFLNGQTLVVTGASTTQLTANFTHSHYTNASDRGNVAVSATGIIVGPDGTLASNSASGDHENFNRIRVLGFNYGITWGPNSWSDTVFESLFIQNNYGVYFNGPYNTGENLKIVATSIQNNYQAVLETANVLLNFYSVSFDFNNAPSVIKSGTFYSCHWEGHNGAFLTGPPGSGGASIEIYGGEFFADDTTEPQPPPTGYDPYFISLSGTNESTLRILGTNFFSQHKYNQIIDWRVTGANSILDIESIIYAGDSNLPTLTSANCNFPGCYINDGTGMRVTSVNSSSVTGVPRVYSANHGYLAENGSTTLLIGTGPNPSSNGALDFRVVGSDGITGYIDAMTIGATGQTSITSGLRTGAPSRFFANGTTPMPTGALAANACSTVTAPSSGVTPTMHIQWNLGSTPVGVAGYGNNPVTIKAWLTGNNVNFIQCATAAVTPGAMSINWTVF